MLMSLSSASRLLHVQVFFNKFVVKLFFCVAKIINAVLFLRYFKHIIYSYLL